MLQGDILLAELMTDFLIKGGVLVEKKIKDLSEIKEKVVVNSSSYGSKELFKDNDIKMVKGQLVYVDKPKDWPDVYVNCTL